MKRVWIVAGLGLALGLAGLGWWAWPGNGMDPKYRMAKVELGVLQAAVSAAGTVTPVTQVQVGTQVSGQIKEVLADFNSEVKAGQLIARIDPESFEYRVRQASADLEAARASALTAQANVWAVSAALSRARVDLDEARRDFERKQSLVEKQFISPAEADRVRANVNVLSEQFKAAEAQLAVARAQGQSADAVVKQRDAQLAQARVDLGRTQIRSPVDGVVIKRSIELGQTVAASLQAPELFIIARNLRDMQVEASIDEADIGRVRASQKVSFTVDAFPGRSFDGEVRQVRKAALTTQNVVTYTAVVSFANPDARLLPGMTANVRIVTEARDHVLKVPNAALRVRLPGFAEPAAALSGPAAAPAAAAELAPAAGVAGRPSRPSHEPSVAELAGRQVSRGRVFVLTSDGKPAAVSLRLGITDGFMTEVLGVVGAGELTAGQEVITGTSTAAANSVPRPGGPRLFF